MSGQPLQGRDELAAARAEGRGLIAAVAVFSLFVNALMLTGPIFMLQVYDRVLGSRSQETLLALFGLVVALFAAMGLLDLARARIMTRLAARFQTRLDRRVFAAALSRSTVEPGSAEAATALRDLEAIRLFVASPVAIALFDMPWAPFFLLAVFMFHPWLGLMAVAGGVTLILGDPGKPDLHPARRAGIGGGTMRAERMADQLRDEAEMIQSIGMRGAGFARWPRRAAARSPRSSPGRGPLGHLHHLHQDLPAFPAIGDAGARRLAGAQGRTDAGRDDRRRRS